MLLDNYNTRKSTQKEYSFLFEEYNHIATPNRDLDFLGTEQKLLNCTLNYLAITTGSQEPVGFSMNLGIWGYNPGATTDVYKQTNLFDMFTHEFTGPIDADQTSGVVVSRYSGLTISELREINSTFNDDLESFKTTGHGLILRFSVTIGASLPALFDVCGTISYSGV